MFLFYLKGNLFQVSHIKINRSDKFILSHWCGVINTGLILALLQLLFAYFTLIELKQNGKCLKISDVQQLKYLLPVLHSFLYPATLPSVADAATMDFFLGITEGWHVSTYWTGGQLKGKKLFSLITSFLCH